MAKKKVRKQRKHTSVFWPIIIVFSLFVGLFLSLRAVNQQTPPQGRAAVCSDNGCKNVQNGNFWMITNCNCGGDADGDQQLCTKKGRIGICGGKQYCCPGPNQKWTADMSACSGSTYGGSCPGLATPTPTATATPKPTATSTPTPTATATPKPTATSTPTPTATSKPKPTATRAVTPSPTGSILDSCGKTCSKDADCPTGLTCASLYAGFYRACRNPSCTDKQSCLCSDGTGGFPSLIAPSPGEDPAGAGRTLVLSVAQFTNSRGEAGRQPTISGTTEKEAKVTVTISPDGVGGEVWADANGRWVFRVPKKLDPGQKTMLVVATKEGAQGQATQSFIVAGGGGFSFGTMLAIVIVAAIAFGGYALYKSSQ